MTWNRILGHDKIVEAFQHAHERGRFAHAYLFCGPEGVGKSLLARELGRAILCEKRAPTDPLTACGTCPACVQVEADTHPDFTLAVRPEESLEFPIELMREVCRGFLLKSVRGHGKVVVIDDADDLNVESANCFLKTLEEPPARSVLILIGSTPERQLKTIVSRCQTIRFSPLSEKNVDQILQDAGIDDEPRRERLVRLGEGSPGIALALADDALWAMRTTILQGLLEPKIDVIALSNRWWEFVQDAGKESAAQRNRTKVVLRLLVKFLSASLAVSVKGQPDHSDPEDEPLLELASRRLGPDKTLSLMDRCLEADHQIDRRVQLVLVLEGIIDAMAQQFAA